jgi:hypothetical protein
MQVIYADTPETNHTSTVYNVPVIRMWQFMVHVIFHMKKNLVFSRQYFPKYVCSARFGCCLYSGKGTLSKYDVQSFSE